MLPIFETPDPIAVLAIFGPIFLPLVTSLLKRPGWSNSAKRALAIGVSVVAAVGFALTQGYDLTDWTQITGNAVYVWLVAQTAFAHLWKDTAIESRLAGQEPIEVERFDPI